MSCQKSSVHFAAVGVTPWIIIWPYSIKFLFIFHSYLAASSFAGKLWKTALKWRKPMINYSLFWSQWKSQRKRIPLKMIRSNQYHRRKKKLNSTIVSTKSEQYFQFKSHKTFSFYKWLLKWLIWKAFCSHFMLTLKHVCTLQMKDAGNMKTLFLYVKMCWCVCSRMRK